MSHGISLNDFYVRDGLKMGNVHAHAITVSREETLAFLRRHAKRVHRLPAALQWLIAAVGSGLNRAATVFSTVVEDLPYLHNRVAARAGSLDDVNYEYYYPDELRVRSWRLFDGFSKAVNARFWIRPLRPLGMLNVAHVCGTCRFGNSPRSSVLDRNNRVHDLDNLYVLDASFFPSSGGINPSLTIVANSLRVSQAIAGQL